MQSDAVIHHIVTWLKAYSTSSHTSGFVIGISGGIDSAVTSTLCAMTHKKVLLLNMPIRQFKNEFDRSNEHIDWLKKKFTNVESATVELTDTFTAFENTCPENVSENFLAMANTRARLRMLTLYAFATQHHLLVAGTGNKVEDFGVGFFTKYGDGGVDLSPIADLFKTEVYEIAKALHIVESIQNAAPTDGLFSDSRSDEDQIGATYAELEWAMQHMELNQQSDISERQKEVLSIFRKRHMANLHKMMPIPVCEIPHELKNKILQ
jgi:NAD+ synthase